jgi:hypothetical protein
MPTYNLVEIALICLSPSEAPLGCNHINVCISKINGAQIKYPNIIIEPQSVFIQN